jgi:hypothetical protein
MSNINNYLAQQAAVIENPLTFTSSTGAANLAAGVAIIDANIQLFIDLISLEGADATVKRANLDEMSPQARIAIYKILTDLKTAVAA